MKTEKTQKNTELLVISILFVLSGTAGLIYELVWTRLLVLIFGNTLFATSTVLSSFMAGLAGGSYYFGRYIDRSGASPVKVYAVLELGIGGFALVFPLVLDLVAPLYVGVYRLLSENMVSVNLVRFGVCFLLIFIPTFLMGGTLPVLVKALKDSSNHLGHRAGLLYGLNTLGAVVGCVLCGFVFLSTIGMQYSSFVAVGLNGLVAVLAWLWSRKNEPAATIQMAPSSGFESLSVVAGHTHAIPSKVVAAALVAVAISGFCSLSYQIFWNRMLNLFFRNSVYSFTTILATFLVGIAVGSLLYYRFLSRVAKQAELFSILQIMIAVVGFLTPYIFTSFHEVLFSSPDQVMIFLKSSAIMLVPTVMMGISLPLAINICQKGSDQEGVSVGRVYAFNTVGSIVGPFLAGFVLIPMLGVHKSINVAVGCNLFAGVLLLVSLTASKARMITLGISLLAFILLFATAPKNLFKQLYQSTQPHADILTYKEGTVANVVVYDFWKEGYKDLYLNGVEEASSRVWHVQLFKMLGILPGLMHANPDNGLMIAFGAGMSAGASTDVVDSLDCVELNPDIQAVAEIFSHENKDVYHNPKFNFIQNDGRNQLYLSPKKYSVIISDATHPMSFDSWTLYSKEFYQLCKDRLKPNGVFCQWIPMPLTGDALKVILNTFRSVFPHMSFWVIHGSSQCMMLATPERLHIDYQRLSKQLALIWESSGFEEYGVDTVEKFLSFFFAGEEKLGEILKDFDKISTDDLPHAQFYGVLDSHGIQTSLDLVPHQETIEPYLINLGQNDQLVRMILRAYLPVAKLLNIGFLKRDKLQAEKARFFVSGTPLENDENIKSMLDYDTKKKQYFVQRVRTNPEDHNAHNTLGHIYQMEEKYKSAVGHYEKALELKPDFANARFNLATALTQQGLWDQAVDTFLQVRNQNPTSTVLQAVKNQLNILYIKRKLSYQPDDQLLLKRLSDAYLQAGDPVKALDVIVGMHPPPSERDKWMVHMSGLYQKNGMGYEELSLQRTLQGSDEDTVGFDHHELDKMLPRQGEVPYRLDPGTKEGDLGKAQQSYKNALQLWDEFTFDGKIEPENLIQAAEKLEEAIQLDPQFMHAYSEITTLYEVLNNHERAISLLKQGLTVSPGFRLAETHINRLTLLNELKNGTVEGEALVGLLVQLGGLSMEVGEVEQAKQFFKRAAQLRPNDAKINTYLGLAYVTTGRYETGLEHLKQAARENQDLKEAQDQIEHLEMVIKNKKHPG